MFLGPTFFLRNGNITVYGPGFWNSFVSSCNIRFFLSVCLLLVLFDVVNDPPLHPGTLRLEGTRVEDWIPGSLDKAESPLFCQQADGLHYISVFYLSFTRYVAGVYVHASVNSFSLQTKVSFRDL